MLSRVQTKILRLQAASGPALDFSSPEEGAIALGTFKLAASLLAPFAAVKFSKKTIFIMSGALASLSLACGNLYYCGAEFKSNFGIICSCSV